MKTQSILKGISVVILSSAICLACKKEKEKPPVPATPTPVKTDYRNKYLGLYTGRYTGSSMVGGNFNYWVIDTTFTDSLYKATGSDSVIVSRAFGQFTVAPTGTATTMPSLLTIKTIHLRNDSLLYSYTDFSAGGGTYYSNQLNAKKHP